MFRPRIRRGRTDFQDNVIMQRQQFHITAESGWINDPNAPVYYKGRYHVFFQYHPYSVEWGPMHWGHVVSDDLVTWERLPVALKPEDKQDKDGCFSGTAIVEKDRLYILYTGVVNENGKCFQRQCLAYSDDGIKFLKHPEPVIGSDEVPEGFSPYDFRDPCVFKKEGRFYMLVASRKGEKSDILLYTSFNLIEWKYVGAVLDYPSSGKMIECPCWNEKAGLMIYSDQFSEPRGTEHLNIHSNFFRRGTLDCNKGKFSTISEGIIDYGFDFYAAQFFANTEKTVMIAWMQMWDRNIPCKKEGFAGMLTLPRYVTVKEGRLLQSPVGLDKYISEKTVIDKHDFKGVIKAEGSVYQLKIDAEKINKFKLYVKKGEGEFTSLYIENGFLVLKRSESGETIIGAEKDEYSLSGIRKMPLQDAENISLIVISDRFSLEIFCEGKALTSTVYAAENSRGIEIEADALNIKAEIGELSFPVKINS